MGVPLFEPSSELGVAPLKVSRGRVPPASATTIQVEPSMRVSLVTWGKTSGCLGKTGLFYEDKIWDMIWWLIFDVWYSQIVFTNLTWYLAAPENRKRFQMAMREAKASTGSIKTKQRKLGFCPCLSHVHFNCPFKVRINPSQEFRCCSNLLEAKSLPELWNCRNNMETHTKHRNKMDTHTKNHVKSCEYVVIPTMSLASCTGRTAPGTLPPLSPPQPARLVASRVARTGDPGKSQSVSQGLLHRKKVRNNMQ